MKKKLRQSIDPRKCIESVKNTKKHKSTVADANVKRKALRVFCEKQETEKASPNQIASLLVYVQHPRCMIKSP